MTATAIIVAIFKTIYFIAAILNGAMMVDAVWERRFSPTKVTAISLGYSLFMGLLTAAVAGDLKTGLIVAGILQGAFSLLALCLGLRLGKLGLCIGAGFVFSIVSRLWGAGVDFASNGMAFMIFGIAIYCWIAAIHEVPPKTKSPS